VPDTTKPRSVRVSTGRETLRFPDRTWDEPEAAAATSERCAPANLSPPAGAGPDACRPVPEDEPLPRAYRLYLPSDGLTIWYTVIKTQDRQVVIVVQ
jgi:hypothetical protein